MLLCYILVDLKMPLRMTSKHPFPIKFMTIRQQLCKNVVWYPTQLCTSSPRKVFELKIMELQYAVELSELTQRQTVFFF